MPKIITFTIVAMALALSACSDSNTAQDHAAHDEEHQAQQPTNRIEIPATVRNNIGITFAKVERRRIDSTIRVPGAFELQPRASANRTPLRTWPRWRTGGGSPRRSRRSSHGDSELLRKLWQGGGVPDSARHR